VTAKYVGDRTQAKWRRVAFIRSKSARLTFNFSETLGKCAHKQHAINCKKSRAECPGVAVVEIDISEDAIMHTQIIMDHTGDTRHQFDPADAAAIAEAEKRFKQLTGAGFTAAKRLGEGKSEVLKAFDPRAEETLFIPRLTCG
jgi:hypothetical protein